MIHYISNYNNYKKLNLHAGDTVLFQRGMFVRGKLENVEGVDYGAYGEGENPTFCGSHDLSDKNFWQETEPNIWKCVKPLKTEVCNYIFNDGELCGTLRWDRQQLIEQGDFWDNCFGLDEAKEENHAAYQNHMPLLYSKGNPALYYEKIECVTRDSRFLANMVSNTVISDIDFINNGVHAIAGTNAPKNVVIKNCRFRFIGGCVWDKQLKIRFGNAIECWDVCENVTVENCRFYNIYDSAVTHQGGKDCKCADRFDIRNNFFEKCGMAAYEQRDLMPRYAEFCDNICKDAGEGFSRLGEVMPRRSEIWPEPMGHHIFLWRIDNPAQNGRIWITNNTFGDAPFGKAIYDRISPEAKKQLVIKENHYTGRYYWDGEP